MTGLPGTRTDLTAAQRAALAHVTAVATRQRARALERLGDVPDLAALVAAAAAHGRVTLNFHPDRLLADGRTVAASMAADGRYRSQFETGVSNGSRTAFLHGDRDRWEESLFGGAYQSPGTPLTERPLYGGLNLLGHPDGACPRFGSCHVRLRPSVNPRCTVTVGDSHLGPADVGTLAAFETVLAGLVERARETGVTLGRPGADPLAVLRGLASAASAEHGRALDDYLEVQVHGPVDLAADAEALVLDPSFRGTPDGDLLAELAARLGIGLEWHAGFELTAAEVGPDFRGPAIPPLATDLCRRYAAPRGTFDAELIGRAAADMLHNPHSWAQHGTPDDLLQYVKQLWHTLVHTGRPFSGR
ncbi:hypothetical protein Cme02nite_17670 [Catellatospora methionotrophica]|uniref:DUF3626 domain-containing protein n=1 Tax=Catellatospora methionotrophica TaxID=121620 RepID=A0A8J3LFE5_9ACTN|nr:DUF3626 domain-containing protein [Catellatospora methionotrophica]GIG13435.1 hypothetical protein Cme02nite_17670 [Catellatospora methionotrophica]